MSDVFVSYSSRDRDQVKPIVEVLERSGWSVWWDREIGAGAAFDRKIEQALDASRCVVVVWSKAAVDSEWVRAEAHDALERGVLVPVRLDDTRPPLAFRRLQTIALDNQGASREEHFAQLTRAIAILAPPPDDLATNLTEGREAYRRHDWDAAYRLLSACDAKQPLAADDLERLSWAAFWTARVSERLALLERAEDAYRRLADLRGVARMGLNQARLHYERYNFAVAEGVTRRVTELLAAMPESPEHGLMACGLAQISSARGDAAAAIEHAERGLEIGRRTGDLNVEAMAHLWLGRTYLLEGRIAEGIALHDQATASATSGELDPYYSGYIYCQVINACRDRADWHRAAEWTERADRLSERESVGQFPGLCRVHRAEIMRFRGALRDAERDVLRGCELLGEASPVFAAQGFRELAEIRLRLGDFAGAEAACREVAKVGIEPQPVLAKLKLLRGDATNALASLERALADQHVWHRGNHATLLPAQVTIALAVGNTAVAELALTRLDALATKLGTPVVEAATDRARGEIDLANGRCASAIGHLRRSVMRWIEERAPYEAAQAQCLLAAAYEREADIDAATLELELALSTFEKLGAAFDIKATNDELARIRARAAG